MWIGQQIEAVGPPVDVDIGQRKRLCPLARQTGHTVQFSPVGRRGGRCGRPSGRERPVDVGLLLAVRGARCLVTNAPSQ